MTGTIYAESIDEAANLGKIFILQDDIARPYYAQKVRRKYPSNELASKLTIHEYH